MAQVQVQQQYAAAAGVNAFYAPSVSPRVIYAGGVPAAPAAAPYVDRPRVVIGVHGRDKKARAGQLHNWWKAAMREGLMRELALTNGSAPDFHFDLVYYADNNTYGDGEDTPDPEPYLQTVSSPAAATAAASASATPALVNWIKYKNAEDYYYNRAGDRGFLQKRLLDAVLQYEGADVLVVAHGMGALIAYDVLSKFDQDIQRRRNRIQLATLGAPFGVKDVQYRLAATEFAQRLRVPAAVARWIDHVDARDAATTDYFYNEEKRPEKNDSGVFAEHAVVRNDYPSNPHKVYGYLRTPEFARVLSAFLGARDVINGAARAFAYAPVAAAAAAPVYYNNVYNNNNNAVVTRSAAQGYSYYVPAPAAYPTSYQQQQQQQQQQRGYYYY